MTANPHLVPQLDAYLRLEKPGFALMVDAAWGAGKTHSVQRWLYGKNHLFVSLYGATSREEIERAIIMARLNALDNSASRALAAIVGAGVEVAAGYFKIEKPKGLQKIALAALPDLLVFDDLERTEGIPVHSLLGALNRYVEHENRHVILLANQTELRKGCDDYDRVREKVIGRVIALEPDDSGALTEFLEALRGQQAHGYLLTERDAIQSVFRASECQNLRLLRQALLEYARFFAMVPEDLQGRSEPMRHVLATFLALTIAFHEGKDFGLEDLGQNNDSYVQAMLAQGKEELLQLKGYAALVKRYEHHPFVRLHQTAISGTLSRAFIGRGHTDGTVIEQELRRVSVFSEAEFESWQTLWWWHRNDSAEVAHALATVRDNIASQTITNPWVILHIAGIFLDLSKQNVITEGREEIVNSMCHYIDGLRRSGRLNPEKPVLRWDDDFRHEYAFGLGILERETAEFQKIKTALKTALDVAFWDRSRGIAEHLLEMAKTAPSDFIASISQESHRDELTSYANIPILAQLEPAKAAELFCSLPPYQARLVISTLADRVQYLQRANRDGIYAYWPDECAWLREVRDEMHKIAEATEDSIRKAQRMTLISWHLRFLDPAPPEKV